MPWLINVGGDWVAVAEKPRTEQWARLSQDQKQDAIADDLDGHDRDLVRIEAKIDRLTSVAYGAVIAFSAAGVAFALNLAQGAIQ